MLAIIIIAEHLFGLYSRFFYDLAGDVAALRAVQPVADAIRARLAGLLRVDVSRVSVKGKTNEKMDDVGAGVGIEAHAVVLLEELGVGK